MLIREPDPEDDGAVSRAIEQIVDLVATRPRGAELGWAVGQLLELKSSYLGDGLLNWSIPDVWELLIEIFPRKVVLERQDPPLILEALRLLVNTLAEETLLGPGGDAQALIAYADSQAGPFAAALADESNWGMGKRLLGGWQGEGVDIGSQADLDAAMASFNALPRASRDQILGPLPGLSRMAPLPPVVLPTEAEVGAAVLATTGMTRMRAFVDFVGEGRQLTQTGQLKLADARALITLLGTHDVMDPVIGDRTFKTTSAVELRGVDTIFTLCRDCGFVKIKGTKVVASSRAARLYDDPTAAWMDLAAFLVDEFAPTSQAWQRDHYGIGWFAPYLDNLLPELLEGLYRAQGPQPLTHLGELAVRGIDRTAPDTAPDLTVRSITSWVRRAFGLYADFGLLHLDGEQPQRTADADDDGSASLAPLGIWWLQRVYSRLTSAPGVGGSADLAAADLLRTLADCAEDQAFAELEHWLGLHGPDELVAALPSADAASRSLAFRTLLRRADDDAYAQAMLTLPADGPLGAYVMVWLVDAGRAQASDVVVDDSARLIELLAVVLDIWGPASLPHWTQLLAGGRALELIETAWRVEHPLTAEVLSSLGGASTDKALAKAARKAEFRRRSAR